MKLIAGEKVLQMFNSVEDTKGNSGEKGLANQTTHCHRPLSWISR